MPAFAASATVVRADEKSGRLVRTAVVVASVVWESKPLPSKQVESKLIEARSVVPVSSQTPSPAAEPPVAEALTSPKPAPSTTSGWNSTNLGALVDEIAVAFGVEESLVHSIIRAESNYNLRALSPKGAQGLMQLIPSTARRFGVLNAFDPKDNIQGGVRYLKFLLDYYRNDYARAIAAYNAGEGAVDKYRGIPPFPETQNYVYQVAKNLKTARQLRAGKAAAVPVAVSALNEVAENGKPETYRPIHTSLGEDGRVYYSTP